MLWLNRILFVGVPTLLLTIGNSLTVDHRQSAAFRFSNVSGGEISGGRPSTVDGRTSLYCYDDDGSIVEDGFQFTPSDDPCKTCHCQHGSVMCVSVQCSPPACNFKQVPGECCKFICVDGNDLVLTSNIDQTNLGVRMIATAITSLLVLSLLVFMIHRLRQRQQLINSRRVHRGRTGSVVDEDEFTIYMTNIVDHMGEGPQSPYGDPPPPYTPRKSSQDFDEAPPPYSSNSSTTDGSTGNANICNENTGNGNTVNDDSGSGSFAHGSTASNRHTYYRPVNVRPVNVRPANVRPIGSRHVSNNNSSSRLVNNDPSIGRPVNINLVINDPVSIHAVNNNPVNDRYINRCPVSESNIDEQDCNGNIRSVCVGESRMNDPVCRYLLLDRDDEGFAWKDADMKYCKDVEPVNQDCTFAHIDDNDINNNCSRDTEEHTTVGDTGFLPLRGNINRTTRAVTGQKTVPEQCHSFMVHSDLRVPPSSQFCVSDPLQTRFSVSEDIDETRPAPSDISRDTRGRRCVRESKRTSGDGVVKLGDVCNRDALPVSRVKLGDVCNRDTLSVSREGEIAVVHTVSQAPPHDLNLNLTSKPLLDGIVLDANGNPAVVVCNTVGSYPPRAASNLRPALSTQYNLVLG